MGNKQKGANAERELYQMFIKNNYRAVRTAGSGTMENADCDIIAGKKGKKYCIEAKSSKKPIKYITKEQINKFIIFSQIFGLTPVIAIRFNRLGWFFLNPKDMKDAGKHWMVDLEIATKKGKKFSQYFIDKPKKEKETLILEKEIEELINQDYQEEEHSP